MCYSLEVYILKMYSPDLITTNINSKPSFSLYYLPYQKMYRGKYITFKKVQGDRQEPDVFEINCTQLFFCQQNFIT